jgi:hypothetical protein
MRELYAQWKLSPLFGHGLRFWYYNPDIPISRLRQNSRSARLPGSSAFSHSA